MNEEFNFCDALRRIQPTESAFQSQSNSLLGIDYPFKESSLSYTNNPLDVKDNVYLLVVVLYIKQIGVNCSK